MRLKAQKSYAIFTVVPLSVRCVRRGSSGSARLDKRRQIFALCQHLNHAEPLLPFFQSGNGIASATGFFLNVKRAIISDNRRGDFGSFSSLTKSIATASNRPFHIDLAYFPICVEHLQTFHKKKPAMIATRPLTV